jgi:putative ABC transport system permease protein
LEKTWKKFEQNYPFTYIFIDDAFDRLYRNELRIGSIFKYFAYFTIVISLLGLFGLAAYITEQRTKEIGVRKVLGSSLAGIVVLLSKEFVKWTIYANLIAWPAAYLLMGRWLQDFAYRTSIKPTLFLITGFLSLGITLFTVAIKATWASRANPADSLKYE